jgi:hypothetical protein
MKLPRPRPSYDRQDEALARTMIEQADAGNYKRGQDVEIAATAGLIIRDEAGLRYRVTVIGGVVTAVRV